MFEQMLIEGLESNECIEDLEFNVNYLEQLINDTVDRIIEERGWDEG